MKSLIQRQEETLSKMSATRSSERRALKMQRGVVHDFAIASEKLGYTKEQVDEQVRDLWDMHELHANAETLA